LKRRIMFLAAVVAALSMTAVALAAAPADPGNNWRVYNIKPATNSWDINKAQADGTGGFIVPFQQFLTTTTGSFAVYLKNNYNVDLTGKTITAAANWTLATASTQYVARSPGAYVRVEFQDVASGPFTSSDYWWYTGNVVDLNSGSTGTWSAPLTDRANWSNICGQSANDQTVYPAKPNCVGGTDPAGSPYDGFTNAMKSVKQVGLSFGSSGSYASGVAAMNTSLAIFDMTNFAVTP
jgi:hypothetical protein